MNIILTGYRGCGKSGVGKILAAKLNYSFMDCDRLFVDDCGMSISAYVAQNGWPAFREAEARILKELLRGNNQVIATGGGIVLLEETRKLLQNEPFTVWLTAAYENIVNRIKTDEASRGMRPPLGGYKSLADEVAATLNEREPLYAACANLRMSTDLATQAEIADEILKAWRLIPASF